jgi:hypothetical protein
MSIPCPITENNGVMNSYDRRSCVCNAPPNKRMHPSRDTAALIFSNGAGGRVMPGVRHLDNLDRTHEKNEPMSEVRVEKDSRGRKGDR